MATPIALTKDQMDRVIEQHYEFERAGDSEGVLSTLTDDVEHDFVGDQPEAVLRGKEAVQKRYAGVYDTLAVESVTNLRRYYGEDHVVSEDWAVARVYGPFAGADGAGTRVEYRMLHIFAFRDGLISRENVWQDVNAIQRQLGTPPGAPS